MKKIQLIRLLLTVRNMNTGQFWALLKSLGMSEVLQLEAKKADGRQRDAIEFFMQMINAPARYVAVENPVCIMSGIYRKPDQIMQPWMFGHGETKATCFWLKNLPLLKPTNIVEGREQRIWKMPPGPDRWKERSRTFAGIAEAMADQWGNAILSGYTMPKQMQMQL